MGTLELDSSPSKNLEIMSHEFTLRQSSEESTPKKNILDSQEPQTLALNDEQYKDFTSAHGNEYKGSIQECPMYPILKAMGIDRPDQVTVIPESDLPKRVTMGDIIAAKKLSQETTVIKQKSENKNNEINHAETLTKLDHSPSLYEVTNAKMTPLDENLSRLHVLHNQLPLNTYTSDVIKQKAESSDNTMIALKNKLVIIPSIKSKIIDTDVHIKKQEVRLPKHETFVNPERPDTINKSPHTDVKKVEIELKIQQSPSPAKKRDNVNSFEYKLTTKSSFKESNKTFETPEIAPITNNVSETITINEYTSNYSALSSNELSLVISAVNKNIDVTPFNEEDLLIPDINEKYEVTLSQNPSIDMPSIKHQEIYSPDDSERIHDSLLHVTPLITDLNEMINALPENIDTLEFHKSIVLQDMEETLRQVFESMDVELDTKQIHTILNKIINERMSAQSIMSLLEIELLNRIGTTEHRLSGLMDVFSNITTAIQTNFDSLNMLGKYAVFMSSI
ncbi:MAG: hypothetical protein NVSMB46_02260 [Candidatus Saccharimonadales bacterium]